MYKEKIQTMGRTVVTEFKAQVRTHIAPKIVMSFNRDGILYYKDDQGKEHIADTYDRIFGKRDSSAILPKGKAAYQRTFKRH